MSPLKPIRFISEEIEPLFDKPPILEKKPHCPDGFIWDGNKFNVIELLSEWHDYSRRGRMAHSMRPANLKKAARRGSVGVGRFFYRVMVESGQIFEIVYDRAVKNVEDRKGGWILRQEMGGEG